MATDALDLHRQVRDSYIRYYETLFALRHEKLSEERRALLLEDGAICREPWLEPIARHVSSGRSLEESVTMAGCDPDLAPYLSATGVFDRDWSLYSHQEGSLSAVRAGKNVAVTAGTGAGKTESLFFPIFDLLLEESRSWPEVPPVPPSRWWEGGARWEPQRADGEDREQAVRALVLYPMNALVEDQMQRLRLALDSPLSADWLDKNRGGNRFYFGRYTGRTPVAGDRSRPSDSKKKAMRQYMQEMQSAYVNALPNQRQYFQNPDGSEMRSRWDMQVTPPDVLITNYSMLNVMLQRDTEAPIFKSTADWLAADDSRKFIVAIDELHVYRGTAGTEVALLLRQLLHRIGIGDRLDRVRFLAASASAGDSDDHYRGFLAEFFGVPGDSFEILGSASEKPTHQPDLMKANAQLFVSIGNALAANIPGDVDSVLSEATDTEVVDNESRLSAAAKLIEAADGDAALLAASWDDESASIRARSASQLASTLFGAEPEPLTALRGLLWSMESSHAARANPVSIREHLFFQNVLGFWACSDPECSSVRSEYQFDGRPIGRIYRQPRVVCECGARVLDMLRCQTCNEVFLGGYRAEDPGGGSKSALLVPDFPELDQLPDMMPSGRSSGTYAIYWPTPDQQATPLRTKEWRRLEHKYEFAPAAFNPRTGRLAPPRSGRDGWRIRLKAGDSATGEAIPRYCPHCDDSWERQALSDVAQDPGRAPSPIRFLRTGFEKITQVLTDSLLEQISDVQEERKVVVFTDSRQDAAKLAASMEFRHHEDLVRSAVSSMASRITSGVEADFKGFESVVTHGSRDPDDLSRFNRFRESNPDIARAIEDVDRGIATSEDRELVRAFRLQLESGAARFSDLVSDVRGELLQIGVTPSGKFRLRDKSRLAGEMREWHSLFDFSKTPVVAKRDLTADEKDWLDKLSDSLLTEMLYVAFAGRRRDFESLALGSISFDPASQFEPPTGLEEDAFREVLTSVIRVLGNAKRFVGGRGGSDDSKIPLPVQKFLGFVSIRREIDSDALTASTLKALETCGAVKQWLIHPRDLYIYPARDERFACVRCGQRSLHRSAGACIHCGSEVKSSEGEQEFDNYYAPSSGKGKQLFRLNTEELTGQTDALDAQSRQASFQGIMLDPETPRIASEVDLLSVTTTMEVGVDIGALRAVVMGNMPPMRFNYQQRVGRAGRRGSALSVALTVARGRSHDEHYFKNPDAITGDPPKAPYIDLDRVAIVRRALLADALRRAFIVVRQKVDGFDGGFNVHGQFGSVSDWESAQPIVRNSLREQADETRKLAIALTIGSRNSTEEAIQKLVKYVEDDAADQIDQELSQYASGEEALSEFLAARGLLPMFGFPSRVKTLFTQRPWSLPATKTIDRDEKVAISQWAPGSDIVKDKRIHKVAGVANYIPAGRRPISDPHALGRRNEVHYCRSCGALEPRRGERTSCSVCGESSKEFRRIETIEPVGYRTDFVPQPYREWFDWTSSSTYPRFADERGLHDSQFGRGELKHGVARVVQINDNNGKDFEFDRTSKDDEQGGWIVKDVLRDYVANKIPTLGRPESFALSASKLTDVLLIGINPVNVPDGIALGSKRAPVKGAWYSFGFLLRGAASRLLEVQTDEIEIGIRPLKVDGRSWAEVFLSDSLANGAGYSSHLGKPDVFAELISSAEDLVRELEIPSHADNCDGSCYECLRDFRNMAFHGLLDWRLAADMLDLLQGEFDESRWHQLAERGLNELAEQFDGELVEVGGLDGVLFTDREDFDDRLVVAAHPLLDPLPSAINRFQKDLRDAAINSFGARASICISNGFDLARRPSVVFAGVDG